MSDAVDSPMQRRRLGRTGHMSSVAILGTAALANSDPEESDRAIDMAVGQGVNHVDVAPSYGHAEAMLGRRLPDIRDRVLLACKSTQRTRDGMWAELERSLELLRTDRIDLYQLHAVCSDGDASAVLAAGGAGEALRDAREQGLVRWVGITGHMEHAPRAHLRVLRDLDLDTVMFPVNSAMWRLRDYRRDAEALLQTCADRDLGVMGIKAIARGPWHGESRPYGTWYEPIDEQREIQRAVDFALSLPVHAIPTAGDLRLLPLVLAAARRHATMGEAEREAMIRGTVTEPLLAPVAG